MVIRFAASEPCAKAAPGAIVSKIEAATANREGNRKPSHFIEELIVYLISLTVNSFCPSILVKKGNRGAHPCHVLCGKGGIPQIPPTSKSRNTCKLVQESPRTGLRSRSVNPPILTSPAQSQPQPQSSSHPQPVRYAASPPPL